MEECREVRIVTDEGLETVNAARKHFQVFDIILTSQLFFFFFLLRGIRHISLTVFGESFQIEDERVKQLQVPVVFGTGLVRGLEGSRICMVQHSLWTWLRLQQRISSDC